MNQVPLLTLATGLMLLLTDSAEAQPPSARRDAIRQQQRVSQKMREIATDQTELPAILSC